MRTLVGVAFFLTLALALPGGQPRPVSADERVPVDDSYASEYAQFHGLSFKEAQRSIQLEAEGPALEAELRSLLGESFAGFWIDHRPDVGFVVAATLDRSTDVANLVMRRPYSTLVEFVQVEWSEADLNATAERIHKTLDVPHDLDVDIKTNTVRVSVRHDAGLELSTDVLGDEPVTIQYVQELAKPAAQIYAGLWLRTCTSGFSVFHPETSRYGVLTAAHCSYTQTFGGTDLPFQQGLMAYDMDGQWHTTPGHTDVGLIKTGSTNRTVTGSYSRDQVSVGATLCKTGNSTGKDCGTLESKSLLVGYVPYALPKFGRLMNCDVDMSSDGDSGGPVYQAGVAVGLVSGTLSNSNGCATDQSMFSFINFNLDFLELTIVEG